MNQSSSPRPFSQSILLNLVYGLVVLGVFLIWDPFHWFGLPMEEETMMVETIEVPAEVEMPAPEAPQPVGSLFPEDEPSLGEIAKSIELVPAEEVARKEEQELIIRNIEDRLEGQ